MDCKVKDLIKGTVATIDVNCTVGEAIRKMVNHQTGSVVVTDSGQVAGFFTERDLLERVVDKGRDAKQVRLGEVITRDLVTVSQGSSCTEALRLMNENECRHLLVFDGKSFLGVLSIRDVAQTVGEHHVKKDIMVNVLGGLTLVLTLGVLALLAFQIPRMFDVALRVLE